MSTTFKVKLLTNDTLNPCLFGDFSSVDAGKESLLDWANELGVEVTGWEIFQIDITVRFNKEHIKVTKLT